ncbi:phage tail protein [Chitinophaga japonensis]|nr:tail fiber protein [Chitinophaga japonensis]
MIFGGNFAIRGWAFCQGQIVSISQNTALFSLLGTTYGGNGQTTFALPDLRGRAPIGIGQGPGLSNYVLGQIGGTENTTLLINNMPAHTHTADASGLTTAPAATTDNGTTNTPGPGVVPATLPTVGSGPGAVQINGYAALGTATTLGGSKVNGDVTIGLTGGTQPFSIMNPYIAMNYQIAMDGIFPSRN